MPIKTTGNNAASDEKNDNRLKESSQSNSIHVKTSVFWKKITHISTSFIYFF